MISPYQTLIKMFNNSLCRVLSLILFKICRVVLKSSESFIDYSSFNFIALSRISFGSEAENMSSILTTIERAPNDFVISETFSYWITLIM